MRASISELLGLLPTNSLWLDTVFILDAYLDMGHLSDPCSQLPKGLNQGLTVQGT